MLNTPSEERLDKIPHLYGTYHVQFADKFIYLHFFLNDSDWFVAEYDGEDTFYGFENLHNQEDAGWRNFSFSELKALNINGVEVDCELEEVWEPCPAYRISEMIWRK